MFLRFMQFSLWGTLARCLQYLWGYFHIDRLSVHVTICEEATKAEMIVRVIMMRTIM